MFNKSADLKHFRIFGCKAYLLILNKRLNKFEPRAHANCILAGYDDTEGIYLIFNKTTKTMLRSRDVKFNENIESVADSQKKLMSG